MAADFWDYFKNLPIYGQIFAGTSVYFLIAILIFWFLGKIKQLEKFICEWRKRRAEEKMLALLSPENQFLAEKMEDCCRVDIVCIFLVVSAIPTAFVLYVIASESGTWVHRYMLSSLYLMDLILFWSLHRRNNREAAALRKFAHVVDSERRRISSGVGGSLVRIFFCDACREMKNEVSYHIGIRAQGGGYVGLASGNYCSDCLKKYSGKKIEEL